MATKSNKKNLSLKGHKVANPKKGATSASSKAVTIQVKRKRINIEFRI